MVVIADTSPLNYLIQIDAVFALPALYQRVLIPEAVWMELRHPNAPPNVATWAETLPPWIEVVGASPVTASPDLAELDAGERSAILLAQIAEPGVLLLMDDSKGRQVAERHHVRTIGTLGVLRDAASVGLLDLPAAIDRLRQTTFRASPELLSSLLRSG
jgi:predicted nucleic acid-binding protein